MDHAPHSIRELLPALAAVPVFPLPQTVLFPGAQLPLHIFEPRYRVMVRDALSTHKTLAIALIRDQDPRNAQGHPAIERMCGIGVIVDFTELPDGRYNILLHGRARAHLSEIEFIPPYRRARAELIAGPAGAQPPLHEVTALLASSATFAADIRARDSGFDFTIAPHTPPAMAADLAAHHLVLDARERQAILETLDVTARVQRVTEALALQHAALYGTSGAQAN